MCVLYHILYLCFIVQCTDTFGTYHVQKKNVLNNTFFFRTAWHVSVHHSLILFLLPLNSQTALCGKLTCDNRGTDV